MSKGCRQLLSILLALSFVLSALAGSANIAQASPTEPERDYAHAISIAGTDNATSQSDNITRTILILGYDEAGKMIEDGSNVITLTPEQLAEADRLIEQYKKKYAQDPNRIRFRSGYIITLTAGTIDASILENGKTSGNNYYLIQFYTDQADLDKETRDTLDQIGCILDPVGNHAFYAKIPPEALDTVISLVNNGKVRYLGRVPTEAKYYPELLTKAQQNPNNPIKIAIQVFNDASDSDIATLSQLMRIDWHWTDSIAGEAPAGNIKDIIALNFVRWIEEDLPMGLCNNDGTSAVGDDVVQSHGYTGNGVRVAIVDTGIARDLQGYTYHPDLQNRIEDQYSFDPSQGYSSEIAMDEDGHGTHLAGIIGGSGVNSESRYRGMAPESTLLIYRVPCEPTAPQFGVSLMRAAPHEANIVNCSFG